MTTETISAESSPHFLQRALFEPLAQPDSQSYAMHTTLKVDAIINGKTVSSTAVSLAHLLWDLSHEFTFPPSFTPKAFLARNKNSWKARIILNVKRNREIGSLRDYHCVQFSFRVSREVWTQLSHSKLRLAISTAAEKGRWCRLYTGEFLSMPFFSRLKHHHIRISLPRDILTGHDLKNPIRIELHGGRRSFAHLLGYTQFVMTQLALADGLLWTEYQSSGLQAELTITDWNASLNQTEIAIDIEARSEGRKQFDLQPHTQRSKSIACLPKKPFRSSCVSFSTNTESCSSLSRSGSFAGGKSESLPLTASVDRQLSRTDVISFPEFHE